LPVRDLSRSIAFFTQLGFAFDPRFTDETATCMILSEQAYVMLLTMPKFAEFSHKDPVDSNKSTEVIVAMTAESRSGVDGFFDKVLAAGGTTATDTMDLGFMYSRSFYDLDGHHWEIFWMDPAAFQAA
jgi:predicted lactoylglutathione lyase